MDETSCRLSKYSDTFPGGFFVISANGNGSGSTHGGVERRIHVHLRDVFEQAYRKVYPLLDSNRETLDSGSAHFIRVELHDAFPELHPQDVAILSVSIERVFRERSKASS
jgi:hypothetical protein